MPFSIQSKKSGKTYFLHGRAGSNKAMFYFFSGEVKPTGALEAVPEGMEIIENERTGLPMLRRKK